MPILNRGRELENLENFLFNLDDIVEALQDEAKKKGFPLDLTISSLDSLEKYLLTAIDPLPDEQREPMIGWAARYLGEVVRKSCGGRWRLSIDDPHNLYYGLPVIVDHSTYDIELAPSEAIRNFLARRKPGLLRQIVKNHVDPDDLDLSDLGEK